MNIIQRGTNEKRRQSESHYHRLVEALPAAIYTCDAEGRVTFYNDAAVALWGRAPEIGKDEWCGSWRIFRPDGTGMPLDQCPMAIAIKEGRTVRGEIVIERPDGSRVDVLAHATPMLESSGAVTGAINLLTDISRQKRSEKAMAELAAIVESSDDAIVSKNLDGIVQSWNGGAERIFGFGAEEIVGRPITLIIPEGLRDEEEDILQRVRRGEPINHYETKRLTKDGRILDVSLTVSPVRDASGQVIGASKIARDISETKRIARTLRDADRRKDEFLAMLAHELRNPLSAVSNAVELLGMPGGEKHLEASRTIIGRQTDHLVRLVEDLLDISRITRRIVTLRKEVLDIASVIDRAVETVSPLMESKRHELAISISTEEKPLRLTGDSTRLQQLIANLLTNAARYTKPGGYIQVEARRQNDTIEITVRDNGIGIAADFLPDVFELFSQSERSADRDSGGLGIGLTLVKSIAEMHGGSVKAKSNGLHQGSEFTVRLPALDEDGTSEPARSRSAVELRSTPSRRVLVVDDNQDAAFLLSHLLKASGHTVQLAYDGPAAIEAAAVFQPDAVFLDIGLPDLDGYDVAKLMRQQPGLADVLLIAISGYCQEKDRDRSRRAGFDHHLAKPPDHQVLLTLLAEARPGDASRA